MATTAKSKSSKNKKSTRFVWEGVDGKGRKVKGDIESASAATVKSTLRRQGIKVGKVKRESKKVRGRKAIRTKDIAFATRQLATMIDAGIPVSQCIGGIGKGHENPAMRELFTSVRQDVESGTNLNHALGKHPKHFDQLYTSLVDAGEQSGTLDKLLDRIATYMEKIEAIKSKIKSAMFYPLAVLVVAVVVVVLLLLFVIPQFEELFKGFGADLPSLTKFVVDASRFMQDYWYVVFGIVAGTIFAIVSFFKKSAKFRFAVDKFKLKMPVFGAVFLKSTIARFGRTLATMFGAGVPLVDGLDAVARSCGNLVYEKAILDIKQEVSSGRNLESTMAETGLFPNMVLQMVSTGEESGELEVMLDKVADFYEREVDDAVDAMSSLIEPFMIVILGGLVGTVVVAMYMPIFKLGTVI